MKRFFLLCILILFSPFLKATGSLPTQAELDARLVGKVVHGWPPMTRNEVMAMEPACRAIGMGTVNGVFWAEAMNRNGEVALLDRPEYAMAKNAAWFHHYCYAKLAKLRYFSARDDINRKKHLNEWIDNMSFIVKYTSEHGFHWAYMYLVHEELSNAYFFEKQYAKAIEEGQKALKEKPDDFRAYLYLADSHDAIGEKGKALAIISEGLRRFPNSKPMQRRYNHLGGHLPYPKPYPKVTAGGSPSPSSNSKVPPDNKSNIMPGNMSQNASQKSSDRTVETTSSTQSDSVPEADKAKPQTDKQQIGKPGNPYCRFCP